MTIKCREGRLHEGGGGVLDILVVRGPSFSPVTR